MRLYLSSFRVGDHPERLLSLLNTDRPVAVIANAMDDAPEDIRLAGVEREHTDLRALGLRTEEVDLRNYFASHDGLAAEFSRFEVAWLRGGNVFMLRYALARSGADQLLTDLLVRDELVYAGYSAGPCILAPSLRGLELCDHAEAVREVHGAPPIWDGLGVLDCAIVPHYESPGHPETEALGKVAELYRSTGVPHRALHDGEVIVIDGPLTEII